MKLVLSIAAFAVLMAVRDSVDGVIPRMLIAAAAGVALAFAIGDTRKRRADERHLGHQLGGALSGWSRAAVLLVGLIFVTAWFLPVVEDSGGHRTPGLPGWEAMTAALHPLLSGEILNKRMFVGIFGAASAFSNILFVAGAIRLLASERTLTRRWSWALFIAAGINSYWMIIAGSPKGLLAGYYLWLASFVLLATLARLRTENQGAPRPRFAT